MKLIIGYGNPLRRDDGVGWVVVDALQSLNLPNVMCMAVHQLTPELSHSLSLADTVILVDASVDGNVGDVRIKPIIAHTDMPTMTHHLSPHGLLGMTKWLYDKSPLTVLITITGADFGVGEGLSDVVMGKVNLLVAFVRGMCAS